MEQVCALFFSWNRALVLPLGWLLYPGRRVRRRRIPLPIGSLCSSTALFGLPGVPGALLGSCCVAFGKAVKFFFLSMQSSQVGEEGLVCYREFLAAFLCVVPASSSGQAVPMVVVAGVKRRFFR